MPQRDQMGCLFLLTEIIFPPKQSFSKITLVIVFQFQFLKLMQRVVEVLLFSLNVWHVIIIFSLPFISQLVCAHWQKLLYEVVKINV